ERGGDARGTAGRDRARHAVVRSPSWRRLRREAGRPIVTRRYRAPGRVNLIGEHTDYNDGFVLPVAIDFTTTVAAGLRDDRRLNIRSENFDELISFDLDEPEPTAQRHWSDYPRGVAVVLEQAGYKLQGADLEIRSDVP